MSKKAIFYISLIYILNYCSMCNAQGSIAIPTNNNPPLENPASGQSTKPMDKIEFINPWARASLSPNNNSAAYLTIKNTSDTEYTLIGAGAMEVANNVELHQSFVDEKGVSKMVSIDKIIIPANSEIVLKPAGMHIMLLDLKKALNAGDRFKLALKFLTIGTKVVDVEVKANN